MHFIIAHRLLSSLEHLLKRAHGWLEHIFGVISYCLIVSLVLFLHERVKLVDFATLIFDNFVRLLKYRSCSVLLPIKLYFFFDGVLCNYIKLIVINRTQFLILEKSLIGL